MSFQINALPEQYHRYLRKAEYKAGDNINGSIDSGKELQKALEFLPDDLAKQLAEFISIQIKDAPSSVNKKTLRKADSNDSRKGYNLQIDSQAEFIEALQNLSAEQANKLVRAIKLKVSSYSSQINQTGKSKKYRKSLKKLLLFLLKKSGDPPNASKAFSIKGKKARGFYHVYQDFKSHLKNGGATTSEAQALCFNLMALLAKLGGNRKPMEQAYNYMRYYMMPHDGWESPELPDSKLQNKNYNPAGLMHWMVAISKNAKSGSRLFPKSDNVPYKIYDPGYENDKTPCIPLQSNGKPNLKASWPRSVDTYKFGSATDADQWRVAGLALGGYNQDIIIAKSSLEGALMRSGKYRGVMMFGRYWGANLKNREGWKADGMDLYSGYQDPAVWQIMKKPDIAKKIVKFLEDAQNAFPGKTGLFMPVWKNGKFGWRGADPNTNWMGFQYRAFAHLGHYYYLTGSTKAKRILDKFHKFIKKNWKEDSGGKISIPYLITKGSGRVQKIAYSPDAHGLMTQGLVYLAKKSGDKKYQKDADALLNDLAKNRQKTSGALPDPNSNAETPANLIYNFHQCEAGAGMALYELFF